MVVCRQMGASALGYASLFLELGQELVISAVVMRGG